MRDHAGASTRRHRQAKRDGKYKGRPTAKAKTGQALTLLESGMRATEIARKLNIGSASVYRIKNTVK
ncbi:MAG: helix-turn-helix domain-containing protein [Rhodomicrobium sp.]